MQSAFGNRSTLAHFSRSSTIIVFISKIDAIWARGLAICPAPIINKVGFGFNTSIRMSTAPPQRPTDPSLFFGSKT